MASIYRDPSRVGFRAQVVVRGFTRQLWLGNIRRSAALSVAEHLERLKRATDTGTAAPADTLRWTRSVSPRIRAQLSKWGLITTGTLETEQIPRTLGAFTQHYLDGRTDIGPRAKQRLTNVRRHLLNQWPEATALLAVTPGDCDRFARAMRKDHAPSHAGKIIADARQFFAAAARDHLIESNPFAGINAAQPHDRGREYYLTPEDAQRLIKAASPTLGAVIALARFGGLRVPSEPLDLQWSSIDWEQQRITIAGHKTAARVIPIFPELSKILRDLQETAPDRSVFVFERNRTAANRVWRDHFLTLITKLGLKPWPKLWQNLRASCRTDLESRFPAFVCNAWLGHSSAVGTKHYTRVNETHFALACGVTGGVVTSTPADTTRQPEAKKNKAEAKKPRPRK